MSDQKDQRPFVRFELLQRIEHLFLLLSFSLLAITGLPQRYADNSLSLWIIELFGGIEYTRSIHHISAIVLIILSIFHALNLGYKFFVQRSRPTILPEFKDVKDFLQIIAYNLGFTKIRPEMGRFNFGEKIEYWAVVWGTVIMAITGYVLWNPIVITRFLPGEIVPASKMAHGLEAVLAVVSILTWHLYNVHLKYFNKSIFTGKISYHEMEEEHAGELKQILAGEEDKMRSTPEGRYRRALIYVPIAGVLAVIFLVATYRFFTIEDTAITTIPPQEYAEVYVPTNLQPLPTATPMAAAVEEEIPRQRPVEEVEAPNIVSHTIDESREDCMACHDPYSLIAPAPTDHTEMTNDMCLSCHSAAQEVAQQ